MVITTAQRGYCPSCSITAFDHKSELYGVVVVSEDHWLDDTFCCVREAAETMTLLDAILEGLADDQSGALRDLCAVATRGTSITPTEGHAICVCQSIVPFPATQGGLDV